MQLGADMDAQTSEGWTPLHLAAKECRLHVLNALLADGADSSLVDANGCPALHYAARHRGHHPVPGAVPPPQLPAACSGPQR